jgi:hypothetical protein
MILYVCIRTVQKTWRKPLLRKDLQRIFAQKFDVSAYVTTTYGKYLVVLNFEAHYMLWCCNLLHFDVLGRIMRRKMLHYCSKMLHRQMLLTN